MGDVCSPQIVTLLVTGSLDVAEFLPWELVAAARGHPPPPPTQTSRVWDFWMIWPDSPIFYLSSHTL